VIDLVTRLNRLARVNRNFAWGCEIIVYHLDYLLDDVLRDIASAEKWPENEYGEWIVPENSPWRPAIELVSKVSHEQEQFRHAKRPRGRRGRQ
jgi:hypothetical protein